MNRQKVVIGCIVVSVLAAGGLLSIWGWIGRTGSTSLEQWIGQYLISAVQNQLKPRLTWDRLDFQAPATLVIDRPRLERDGVTLLAVDRLTLGLARVPRAGEPVLIESVVFERPRFHVEFGADGRLLGWSDFLRIEETTSTKLPAPAPRLSDALRIRLLSVNNAALSWRDAQDAGAMTLSGISARLETPPDERDPGWHRIAASVRHPTVFEMTVAGRLNLDRSDLELEQLALDAQLDEKRYEIFPPRIQNRLRAAAIQGILAARLSGRINLRNPELASLNARIDLRDAGMTWGGDRLEIVTLDLNAVLAERMLGVGFFADALGGQTRGTITGDLSGQAPTRIEATIGDVDMAALSEIDAVKSVLPRTAEFLAGRLNATLTAEIPPEGTAISTATVDATVEPLKVAIRGAISEAGAPAVTVVEGPRLSVLATARPNRVTADVEAELVLGKVMARFLRDDAAKDRRLGITLTKVDLNSVLSFVPPNHRLPADVELLGGYVSGDVTIQMPRPDETVYDLDVSLESGQARMRDTLMALTISEFTVNSKDGSLQIRGAVHAGRGGVEFAVAWSGHDSDPFEIEAELHDVDVDALQSMLAIPSRPSFALTGMLSGTIHATIPIARGLESWARASVRLDDAVVRIGDKAAPISRATVNGRLNDGVVRIDFDAPLFSGDVKGGVRFELEGDGPIDLHWHLADAELAEVIRGLGGDGGETFGRVQWEGNIRFNPEEHARLPRGTMRGSIRDGSLVRLPLVSELVDRVRGIVRHVPFMGGPSNDSASWTCDIEPEHLRVERFDLRCDFMGANGSGRIDYGGGLEMIVQAGPIERIEPLLGPVGTILGQASQRLMNYRVSGTMSHPQFTPRPLGINLPGVQTIRDR
ncbi:MAG TPA: hypothetical protein VNT79_15435 [Phycisphaerae bacterium]|nr:hypothetical protein [Phycisphaerae bacterium]